MESKMGQRGSIMGKGRGWINPPPYSVSPHKHYLPGNHAVSQHRPCDWDVFLPTSSTGYCTWKLVGLILLFTGLWFLGFHPFLHCFKTCRLVDQFALQAKMSATFNPFFLVRSTH